MNEKLLDLEKSIIRIGYDHKAREVNQIQNITTQRTITIIISLGLHKYFLISPQVGKSPGVVAKNVY